MKVLLFILVATISVLKTQAQTITSPDNSPIYTGNMDSMPEFKGGMDNFYNRLARIHYTFLDRMYGCQGRVTLMMVVEKDGSLSNLKVVNGLSAKQDEEILRIVRHLNKWIPGTANGQPVRVLCSVPIAFKLIKS